MLGSTAASEYTACEHENDERSKTNSEADYEVLVIGHPIRNFVRKRRTFTASLKEKYWLETVLNIIVSRQMEDLRCCIFLQIDTEYRQGNSAASRSSCYHRILAICRTGYTSLCCMKLYCLLSLIPPCFCI